MTSNALNNLELAINPLIADLKSPTSTSIRGLIDQLRVAFPISDDEADSLLRRLEARHQVQMGQGNVLVEKSFQPWLPQRKADIDPFYWDRYRQLLVDRGLAAPVVASLDSVTDRILGLTGNPELEGEWDRRGMVVGHVQSGKTANYTGLITKAADAGYRLVIVIAGIHNSLRNQTQIRIDEGFIGRDSSNIRKNSEDRTVGVGRFNSTRRPQSFTTSTRDFNSQTADSVGVQIDALKEPAVLVIKKNTSTLKNLIKWLEVHNARRGTSKIAAPMLLIDDEADNASINIKHQKGEVARINGQIRELLNLFERKCYVGYTATPFANIFIDPETEDEMFQQDLFPRDFIVSLEPPSNYVGPTRVFLDESDQFTRKIIDSEDLIPLRHKIDDDVVALPSSMKKAIRTFVLNCAVRTIRGDGSSHNSMLINVSRFTRIQGQVWSLVHDYLGEIQRAVRANGAKHHVKAEKDPDIADLKETWTTEFSLVDERWEDVFEVLHTAIAPIEVRQINSASASALDYDEYKATGLNVIAIGGFSLSRGLTLEGLSVSYFLRNSQAYDTLLQMGRWFGYRPNYDDLCRVWMPEDAAGWFAHIAESVEELRDDFKQMERAGATPREFGLRVRSHPDSLIITARNRIGSAERIVVRRGLKNEYIETTSLLADIEAQRQNRSAAERLVGDLHALGHELPRESGSLGYLLRGVPIEPVTEFLQSFNNDPSSIWTDQGPLLEYLKLHKASHLREWDVLVASTGARGAGKNVQLFSREINLTMRTVGFRTQNLSLKVTNKQRVGSRGIEKVGVNPDAIAAVEKHFSDKNSGSKNFPDRIYRAVRDRPLLILFPLLLKWPAAWNDETPPASFEADASVSEEPIMAWGISFPDHNPGVNEPGVEYFVNRVWLEEFVGDDEFEDDPEFEETNG